jgi:hypothetical protein
MLGLISVAAFGLIAGGVLWSQIAASASPAQLYMVYPYNLFEKNNSILVPIDPETLNDF